MACALFFLLFMSQKATPAINAIITTAIPTPIPAFAPVLKPLGSVLLEIAATEADAEADALEELVPVLVPALVRDAEDEEAVDVGMKSTIVLVCNRSCCGAGALNVALVPVEHVVSSLSQHFQTEAAVSYCKPVR